MGKATTLKDLPTREQAKVWAQIAVETLFAEGDPFMGEVLRWELKRELELAILLKLINGDEPDLTEREFNDCVQNAQRNGR
jgi:hypothetical protein